MGVPIGADRGAQPRAAGRLEHFQPDWTRLKTSEAVRAERNARSTKKLERPARGCRLLIEVKPL
jgi:hypothetical protein